MKTHLTLFSILLLFLIVQSCKRDPCNGKGPTIVMDTTKIAAEDLLKIPFTGSDTLIYYSDQGDTATLIGTGKRLFYAEGGGSLHDDCPKTVNLFYENQQFEFFGNNPELSYLSYHYKMNDTYNGSNKGMEYRINSWGSYTTFSTLNDSQYYNGSCLINGKSYNGYLHSYQGEPIWLYNFHYGFIKITIPQSKTWLKKIKQ